MNQVATGQLSELPSEKNAPIRNGFIFSAAGVLVFAGAAKIWSGFGNSRYLAVLDPLIGISFGRLFLAVGIGEIAIALICFLSKSQTLRLMLVAWISTNFVVYRFGLWWSDWHRPCNCLGNLTDSLQISPQLADNLMKVILIYLLIGSYALLFWQWRPQRMAPTAAAGGS